jgi:hypothetical protein
MRRLVEVFLSLFLSVAASSLLQAQEIVLIDFESFPGPDGILGTEDDEPAPDCFGPGSINICFRLSSEFQTMGLTFNSGTLHQGDWFPKSTSDNHFISSTPLDIDIHEGAISASVKSYSGNTGVVLWALDYQDNVIKTATYPPLGAGFHLQTFELRTYAPFYRFTVRPEGCDPTEICSAILNLDDLKISSGEPMKVPIVLSAPLIKAAIDKKSK